MFFSACLCIRYNHPLYSHTHTHNISSQTEYIYRHRRCGRIFSVDHYHQKIYIFSNTAYTQPCPLKRFHSIPHIRMYVMCVCVGRSCCICVPDSFFFKCICVVYIAAIPRGIAYNHPPPFALVTHSISVTLPLYEPQRFIPRLHLILLH